MKCECGRLNDDDAEFCIRCGGSLSRDAGTPHRLECGECGGLNDDDAEFCIRCGASLGGEEDVQAPLLAAASAPESAPERPARGLPILGIVAVALSIGAGVMRLADRPSVEFEVIDAPAIQYREPNAPLPETVQREAPTRVATETERLLAGTWVAELGLTLSAPRRASTEGFMVQMRAMQQGMTERCLWLELYENLTGFLHECGMVEGEASVLEQTDVRTGGQSALGAALHWSAEGGVIQLSFQEDLVVGSTHIRDIALALPEGSSPFEVVMSFPGHEDTAPQTHVFEAFPGRYLE